MDTQVLGKPKSRLEISSAKNAAFGGIQSLALSKIQTYVSQLPLTDIISEAKIQYEAAEVKLANKRKRSNRKKKKPKNVTFKTTVFTKEASNLYGYKFIKKGTICKSADNVLSIPIATKSSTSILFQSNCLTKESSVIINLSATSIHGRIRGAKITPIKFNLKKGFNLLTVNSMYGGSVTITNVQGLYCYVSRSDKDIGDYEGTLEIEIAKVQKEFGENRFKYDYLPTYSVMTEGSIDDEEIY